MKKETVIAFIVLFLMLIVAVIDIDSQDKFEQVSEESSSEVTDDFVFSCASGDDIKIRYDHKNNEAILLFRGQNYVLQRAISGSGSRYTNEDESIMFWEHQGEAMMSIDGEIVAQNCLLDERSNPWKEFKSGDLIFRAPECLEENYIALQKWPPEIKVFSNKNDWPAGIEIDNGKLKCQTIPEEKSFSKKFYEQSINGRAYAIREESEGAAGSVYTEYTYFTVFNRNLISIGFVLRFSNCAHYPEPQRIECDAERESFDMGYTIDRIVESIKIGFNS